jgi:site-specific DNA-methyltransferase (adenine-specific)
MKPFYQSEDARIELYHGDMQNIVPLVFDGTKADMIFADPPYFLSNSGITCQSGKMVSVNKGRWDESRGAEANHAFNRAWLEICREALEKNGTIWITGTSHVIYSIGYALQQLEYKLLNDIIWEKRNPPPNLSCRYFTHSTETVIWAAKSKKAKHYFNYGLMKNINKGKQMKNVWQINAPAKAEKGCGKHPTQKPLELLRRIIQASTKAGDLILDPFCGSGTTGVAAMEMGRRFVGIDNDKAYLELAKKRIQEAEKNKRLFAE